MLTIAVAIVAFSFARGPLTGSEGAASALARPLTLWVTGGEAAGQTEALARQAASCWRVAGRQASVGVLSGGSVGAVGDFLRRVHGTSSDLLMLSSATLSEIAYEALRPPGSPAHARAQAAAQRLLEATPVAVIGTDSLSLAVRSSSSIRTTAQLLALLRADTSRPMLGVAAEAWLEGGLATLAHSAGIQGEIPFDAYRSSREAIVSLGAGEDGAIVAPHSALATGVRAGDLRELSWPAPQSNDGRGWVAILAPSGLKPSAVSSLRHQASQLCHGSGWHRQLRADGLSPAPRTGPRALHSLIRGGLEEAGRLQALTAHMVRNY